MTVYHLEIVTSVGYEVEARSLRDATHILEAHDAIADDDARVTMVYDFSAIVEQTGGT